MLLAWYDSIFAGTERDNEGALQLCAMYFGKAQNLDR